MLNGVILFLLLLGSWLILSGFFSPLFISLGIFSCLVSMIIAYKTTKNKKTETSYLGFTIRAPSYFIWLMKEIVKSSLDVTVKVWQIEPEISPEIGWVSTNLKSDLALTVYGNSITLTPGTVTTDIRHEGMIQVHALNKETMKDLRKGDMNNRVVKLIGNEV